MASDIDRLRKFRDRANKALTGPVFEASPVTSSGFDLKFNLLIDIEGRASWTWSRITLPEADLVLAITNCRPFMLEREDNYLPRVLGSLRSLNTQDNWTEKLDHLDRDVAAALNGGDFIKSVRAGPDEGDKPMVGDATLAKHYIYGQVLHEDEWRRTALKDHDFPEAVTQAVIMQINYLMKVVYWLRYVMLDMDTDGALRERL